MDLTAEKITRATDPLMSFHLQLVEEVQISRDERNEYHGITPERAQRVIEALGVQVTSQVENLDFQVA